MRHSSASSSVSNGGGSVARSAMPCSAHLALQVEGDLAEDRLLGVEVAVEGAVGGAGPLGDVGHVGGEELLLGEHLGGRLHERGPRALTAPGRAARHRAGSWRDHHGPGMRPWRWSVHEIACSRSQHGSSTRPSWVTGVRSTAMPASWQAASTASSTSVEQAQPLDARRRRGGRPGRRRLVGSASGDDRSRTPATSAASAQRRQVVGGRVATPARTIDRADRPVAQHVALAAQPAAVDRHAELLGPRPPVRRRGRVERRRGRRAAERHERGRRRRARRSWRRRPTDERFHPPNGWRRTMAPVVWRLT